MNNNSPSYYGNLSRVALNFYISTGNPGELVAAYEYARYAARAAAELRMMLRRFDAGVTAGHKLYQASR